MIPPFTWQVLDRTSTRVPGCSTLISVTDTETGTVSVLAVANDVHKLGPASDFFELLVSPAVRADDLEELRSDLIAYHVGAKTSYRDEPACDWASAAEIIASVERENAARRLAKQLEAVAS